MATTRISGVTVSGAGQGIGPAVLRKLAAYGARGPPPRHHRCLRPHRVPATALGAFLRDIRPSVVADFNPVHRRDALRHMAEYCELVCTTLPNVRQ